MGDGSIRRNRVPRNWVTGVVKPYVIQFKQEHGRTPTVLEILERFPEFTKNQRAVEAVLERMKPSDYESAPIFLPTPDTARPRPAKTGDVWQDTIREIDYLRDVVLDNASSGRVDAQAYEKLTRLRVDVEKDREAREVTETQATAQRETLEAIIRRGRAIESSLTKGRRAS